MGFIKNFFRKIRNFFRGIIFLILLPFIIAGVFAAGIYLEKITPEQVRQVNEALSLYKWPFVGNYFDVPEGVEWTKEDTDKATEDLMNTISTGIDSGLNKVSEVADQLMKPEEPPESPPIKISQKEIEQQMQEREAAEKKRISKLARVYASMKAQAAAEAMGNLDADTAILILQKMEDDAAAQILGKMDPVIAAQLTQMMYEGVQQRMPPPVEIRRQLEEQKQAMLDAAPEVESAYVEEEYVEGEYPEEEYVEPEPEYYEEGAEPEYVEGEYTEEVTEGY